jgi:predicted nucleic acid-binding Zn ribbon protein
MDKQTFSIDSELKKELEEFNFKYRRTEYKINISQVCREALKQELERKKRSLPGLKQRTLTEEIFKNDKTFDEPVNLEQIKSYDSDKPVIACSICGTEFIQTKPTRQYCSKKCGTTASRRRAKDDV